MFQGQKRHTLQILWYFESTNCELMRTVLLTSEIQKQCITRMNKVYCKQVLTFNIAIWALKKETE